MTNPCFCTTFELQSLVEKERRTFCSPEVEKLQTVSEKKHKYINSIQILLNKGNIANHCLSRNFFNPLRNYHMFDYDL